MVTLLSLIQIGKDNNGTFEKALEFNYVHECEITASWENITSTAKIIIPKKVAVVSREDGWVRSVPAVFTGENAVIRRGDAVRIYAGYRFATKDGYEESMPLRFQGVVTRVDPAIPITIYCEDIMFKLKQKTIKKWEKPSATLNDIMKHIIPSEYKFKTEDVNIGKFKIEGATVLETLDYLRNEFGFSCFFQDGQIYCGFRYQTSKMGDFVVDESKIPIFHFQHNIVQSSLEYQHKEDIAYKVRVINIKDKNQRTEKEFGDPDGELRTLHFYDADDASLESIAKETLNKMKFTGFRGSFTTFLEPMVEHGEAVKLVDDVIEDRNGVYLVKEVTTTFGVNGGRQKLTLDRVIG